MYFFHIIFSSWIQMWRFAFTSEHQKGIYSAVSSLQFDALNICTLRLFPFDVNFSPMQMRVRVCVYVCACLVGHVTSCHFRFRHTFDLPSKFNRWRAMCLCRIAIKCRIEWKQKKKKAFICLCSFFCFSFTIQANLFTTAAYHGFVGIVYCLVA